MHFRETYIWAVLVAATLLSWFLKGDAVSAKVGATAVILIAAFKINLVVSHFMELKWQPRPFRIVVSIWLTTCSAIIIGGYLVA
jgi:Prokaryotic Cytochrome C oxidase subunit IV